MSDFPLLEAPRISLASSFSLNGWKTATQAILRDTILFQHVLVQVGSFLKFLFPLNCQGTGREWEEYQVESHNSSLESGSPPDLLSFLFCWKSKAACSLLTCLGKCLLGPRQYSSSGIVLQFLHYNCSHLQIRRLVQVFGCKVHVVSVTEHPLGLDTVIFGSHLVVWNP